MTFFLQTTKQIAEYLKVHPDTVKRMMWRGEIPEPFSMVPRLWTVDQIQSLVPLVESRRKYSAKKRGEDDKF